MTYSTKDQKTGVRLLFNGELVGGWNVRERHLFILSTFAEANVDRLRAFRRKLEGIRPTRRPVGNAYYWKLPERDLAKFREAVEAATGKRIPKAFGPPSM